MKWFTAMDLTEEAMPGDVFGSDHPNDFPTSCKVYEDGYVDFENTDAKYESQDAAITALEADGWEIVGVDHE